MDQPCSYAWRGFHGVGKRTQLLQFLEQQAAHLGIPFHLKHSTWYLKKTTASADPEDEDEEATGKMIPYEESALHLGFDCARMSMSDKVFLQSILPLWTGQNDVCLMSSVVQSRYLVLYHAHYLTDESVLQIQECLEQYPTFAILLTTELPLSNRLRDFCLEIPVAGEDKLLQQYTAKKGLSSTDVWRTFFKKTAEEWSTHWNAQKIVDVRSWIYTCLQRNLRWTDVIMYWVLTLFELEWITAEDRKELLPILWKAESGAGWALLPSYRIPILWEHVHLRLAHALYRIRSSKPSLPPCESVEKITPMIDRFTLSD